MSLFVRLRLSFSPTYRWASSTSVRSLRSLATPNGDARSRLSQPKGFEPFFHDKQYSTKHQILNLQRGTKTQCFANFQNINDQLTVFSQSIRSNTTADTRVLHLYVRLSSMLTLAPQAFPSVRAFASLSSRPRVRRQRLRTAALALTGWHVV